MRPQASLLRLAEVGRAEWRIDRERRLGGRGHYLCLSETCLNRAMKQRGVREALEASTVEQIHRMIRGQSEAE